MEVTSRIMVSRERPGRQGGWGRWGTLSLLVTRAKVLLSGARENDYRDSKASCAE